MPAIASLEDLRAAQKEGLKYLRYALCALLFALGDGAASVGKMCVEPRKGSSHSKAERGRHSDPRRMALLAGASCGYRSALRNN